MQFIIYKEIKERFCDHLWLDVVSKCDLLQDSPVVFITEHVDEDDPELSKYRKLGPDGALHVSVKSEVGLSEVSCSTSLVASFVHFHELILDSELGYLFSHNK